MRTTVTLDPDVESLLKKAMKERKLSFKQALNEAIRSGLAAKPGKRRRYEQRTFKMGFQPEIALDKALAMAAEVEDEETLRKLCLRK